MFERGLAVVELFFCMWKFIDKLLEALTLTDDLPSTTWQMLKSDATRVLLKCKTDIALNFLFNFRLSSQIWCSTPSAHDSRASKQVCCVDCLGRKRVKCIMSEIGSKLNEIYFQQLNWMFAEMNLSALRAFLAFSTRRSCYKHFSHLEECWELCTAEKSTSRREKGILCTFAPLPTINKRPRAKISFSKYFRNHYCNATSRDITRLPRSNDRVSSRVRSK